MLYMDFKSPGKEYELQVASMMNIYTALFDKFGISSYYNVPVVKNR